MCRDGWTVFDDFKANAFNHSSGFVVSRKFSALLAALRDDLRCVLADIDFCKPDARAEGESVLRIEAPGLNLAWKFFANDSPACEANIRRRGRASLASDLENLLKYSANVLHSAGHGNYRYDANIGLTRLLCDPIANNFTKN
jgi:hypothetical protein